MRSSTYEQNQNYDILNQDGMLFDQVRAKLENLRQAEELGQVAKGSANQFLAQVQHMVKRRHRW
jgi:hypothetical protein